MIDHEEVDYAAIITVELPGMDRPATVTLTLKPPDAVEVAPGQVKPLRECTLSDLRAFAEALEAELWERYHTLTLSQLADTNEARLKITILGEADEPLSAAQERWLEQTTPGEDGDGGTPEEETTDGGEAAQPADAVQQATEQAEPESEPEPAATEEERDTESPAEEDEGATAEEEATGQPELVVEQEEPADVDKEPEEAREEAVGVGEEAPPVDGKEVSPTDKALPEEVDEQAIGPMPVETPVVEGAEPTTAPVTAPAPEGEIRVAGLRRPVGHPTPAAADILINEPAFREAQEHALSSLDREVAGMLVGPQPEKQPDGRYVVHVTDVIAAKHTRMSGASVTYTPESWRYVTDVLEERYPDGEAVIVGWYHTHPGFGIFLSGMDLFIHQNFFTQAWHVAMVLDPRAGRSGFFCWNREQTAVQPYEFPWPRWAAGSW